MPSPEPKHISTSVLADPALPSLLGDPDSTVFLHSLVQDEVQIEGFFARGLLLGLQKRPRTAHSQQPQAREQPAPRAARPGPTRNHPVARARQLPPGHSPLGSGIWAPSFTEQRCKRGGVTGDSPRGKRLSGAGTPAPSSEPPNSCHRGETARSWEDKESLRGRYSCRRNSGQIPADRVQSSHSGFRRVAADNEARGDSSQDKFLAASRRVFAAHPGAERLASSCRGELRDRRRRTPGSLRELSPVLLFRLSSSDRPTPRRTLQLSSLPRTWRRALGRASAAWDVERPGERERQDSRHPGPGGVRADECARANPRAGRREEARRATQAHLWVRAERRMTNACQISEGREEF